MATVIAELERRGTTVAAGLFVLWAATAAAQDAPAARAWTFDWSDHPSVRFGDVVRIEFRARLQGDLIGSDAALGGRDESGLDLARRRIGIAGDVGTIAEFQVEGELADGDGWRDVYVNYRQLKRLQLQAGRFKLPFGLDENTSSGNLDFVYRSRGATELAPGRDRGVMAHGRAGIFRYEWGAFADDGDNVRGIGPSPQSTGITTAGRLVVQPFRRSASSLEDLQIGVAYTAADAPASIVEMRADLPIGQSFFESAVAVRGARRRLGAEIRWRPGPFSLQSEVTRLTSERLGQSITDTDLPPLVGSAWYLQGTWVVTGETKRKGGPIELAARVEAIRFHSGTGGVASIGPRADTIPPRSDRVMTLGVNWRPHRWIRVQANLIRDALAGPAATGTAERTTVWSRVLRFGFAL